ncbi:MAG: hypothetical protein L0220_00390 [Acidobacteria bacterium]|nr:hypothetical protein [Acidobacteriota bacterium]
MGPHSWGPISEVVFKGQVLDVPAGDETKKQASVGRALSNQIFNGGTIKVDVTFSPPQAELGEVHPFTVEIIVFSDPITGNMVTAGIGEFFLYCVRIWDEKSQKWLGSVIKGVTSGILVKLDAIHTISVTVQSSHIRLSIDGVRLGSADLPFQLWEASLDCLHRVVSSSRTSSSDSCIPRSSLLRSPPNLNVYIEGGFAMR